MNKYLRNKRITGARAIYKILKAWKSAFIAELQKQDKAVFNYEKKRDLIEDFINGIKMDLPNYFQATLPNVMKYAAKKKVSKYKDYLPEGYSLSFNLPTDPAVRYINTLIDTNLAYGDRSTLKTTRDELRRIFTEGIARGDSYTDIGKQIEELDPFVFSETRAKLIASNVIGQAYGWADLEPAREMAKTYVMEKCWITTGDDKVRDSHKENEAQGWIPFEQYFS